MISREQLTRAFEQGLVSFGLDRWTVELEFARLEEEKLGRSEFSPVYQRGVIKLDLEQIKTAEEALRVLRHELLHLVLGDGEAFMHLVDQVVPEGAARDALSEAWDQAMERTVRGIEVLCDRSGGDPWKGEGDA